jgi:hypothetical protein
MTTFLADNCLSFFASASLALIASAERSNFWNFGVCLELLFSETVPAALAEASVWLVVSSLLLALAGAGPLALLLGVVMLAGTQSGGIKTRHPDNPRRR